MKIIKVGSTKIVGHISKGQLRKRRKAKRRAVIAKRSQDLIDNCTRSEELYCKLLNDLGVPFEFQKPLCGYFPDFTFEKQKVIIELDGKYHQDRKAQDQRRDRVLKQAGYTVFRVPSSLIFRDVDRLIFKTKKFLNLLSKSEKTKPVKRPRIKVSHTGQDELTDQFLFITNGI